MRSCLFLNHVCRRFSISRIGHDAHCDVGSFLQYTETDLKTREEYLSLVPGKTLELSVINNSLYGYCLTVIQRDRVVSN